MTPVPFEEEWIFFSLFERPVTWREEDKNHHPRFRSEAYQPFEVSDERWGLKSAQVPVPHPAPPTTETSVSSDSKTGPCLVLGLERFSSVSTVPRTCDLWSPVPTNCWVNA